ncbi:MDR family MFS transporter [Fictibacillus aquaticus]|uniref:MFS transporter n=1 Tax=Fictibacillus aquaticus TaxID=2021314 RepID=A0A235FCJ5_9BACL|nr:MFS transporter [Fictibacillus aquaticus]OYD58677.1 MFS transporter [Fictibacillus aquaticus]
MWKNTINAYRKMDRNIWIRFIGESINGIAMMMLMPFFALYMKDKVDHFWQIGIVMAMGPLAGVLGSLIGGRLADKYGRKPVMIVSMLGNGLVMTGFIFFEGFVPFLILSWLFGLFNSLFHPAASAMVADVTDEAGRTEAFGLLRMGHNIGAAIGPLLGASIVILSKTAVFIIGASTIFVYTIIVAVFITETLPKKGANIHQKEDRSVDEELPSIFAVLFKDKILFLFIITGIVFSMGFSQTEGMLPLHFDQQMTHLSPAQNPYPYLMAFNGTLVVVFQFAISRWASTRELGKVMLYGSLFFGFGLIAVGWLPLVFHDYEASFWTVLAVLLVIYGLYTLGEMLLSPVQMTFVANISPEHLRGTYMGAASLQWIAGGAIGPILAGFLMDEKLGHMLLTVLGAGCLIAGFIYLSLDRWASEAKDKMKGSKKESAESV